MRIAERVVFNTIVLYAKIIASMAIALVSVPLILHALGVSDYGLYNLVAGVVAMLSFLNNSMTVSSQRYMSVAMGEDNERKVNIIYNTSFVLHLVLGLLIVLVFEIIGKFAIDKLNIDPHRLWCAKIIFQFLIISTFSKIVSVPFDALMNAKEDMLSFSVIELIDSVLMLIVAFTIRYFTGDKLIYYGLCVAGISVLTFFMKYGWCRYAYKEYRIKPTRFKEQLQTKAMLGFTGWNLFAGLAMIGRNQGVTIIINLFIGTIANAAYGVANQINGALCHFASTFQRAINPQLMKSEGMGDRDRLIRISFISSKFSVLAICFFAIPVIVEISDVLYIWLRDDIPPYTVELSSCILILSIIYQYSMGLMSSIQATGKIRNYQISMGCLILMNLPLSYLILKNGLPVYYVTMCYVFIECISLIVRINFAKNLVGINVRHFINDVVRPSLLIVFISLSICLIPHFFLENMWIRIFFTFGIYVATYLIMIWHFAFENEQKVILKKKMISFVR